MSRTPETPRRPRIPSASRAGGLIEVSRTLAKRVEPLRHYLARLDGRPVGVSQLFLGQQVAGCPKVPSGIRHSLYTVDSIRAFGMGMMSAGVSTSAWLRTRPRRVSSISARVAAVDASGGEEVATLNSGDGYMTISENTGIGGTTCAAQA